MKADETTGKGNDFWVLWDRTAHAVRRAREIELRLTADLSGVEASLLAFVKESKGPVTPSVLARLLHREPHTVSGLVSRMEKRGLVKKEKNLGRRNLVRVTVTKKGEEAFKKHVFGSTFCFAFPSNLSLLRTTPASKQRSSRFMGSHDRWSPILARLTPWRYTATFRATSVWLEYASKDQAQMFLVPLGSTTVHTPSSPS